MTALRDILDLPPEVKKSDFVVRLTEGVGRPEAMLRGYAVTPDIEAAYDRALTLVGAALRDRQSQATYVHGSFGSGKSHLMAILSLMLGNDSTVWAEPMFHGLRAKHEALKDRRFLRLHFHMVGARTLEEKVFAEYLARARALHPDAPVPPLFEDHALFENAQALRHDVGDEAFFARLNAAEPAAKGWGKLGAAGRWDAASFDAARASADPDERARLFSTLVKSYFPAFVETRSGYVGFDRGLAVIGRHAARLGYDAVVLFLDELILWLMSRASERAWLNTEVQKLAKLLEAQDERRELPIVSFVARQRDIADLVGDQFAGADAQILRDSLRWWEGRADDIRLGDQNLPAIVERRVVRPRDEAARRLLDEAFAEMRRGLGTASWGTLLGDVGDETGFRQVYPFSPALVEALVALSHYLQRERTALRVLMELLVEHLEDFEMGKLVAVGDLFDVLAGGEEPMDGTMKERFAAAKRLHASELLPLIQSENGTARRTRCQRMRDDHPVAIGCSNCAETRCRADNRLAKTLLLAALVPEALVFRNLTASRLVQLNHGTLRSPIPGAEVSDAVGRLRSWAAEVGKVRVGDQADPTVEVALDTVDIKPVLDAARGHDTPGARRRKLQEVLFRELEVESGTVAVEHEVQWRGTRRYGVVHYGNVREMDDAALEASSEHDFKVVIDYPFDEPGHGPVDDEHRIERYRDSGRSTPTVAWLPSFFGERLQRDLGDLVVIDRILQGDSWKAYLQDLRPDDQLRARRELESLGSQKRQRVVRALLSAYGLRNPDEGEMDSARTIDRHFVVLVPGLDMRTPPVARLAEALFSAVDQLLEQRYPRHPRFSDKITRPRLEKNLTLFVRLCEADGQRIALAAPERKDLLIADELGIVQLSESAASLRPNRFQDADRALRADGVDTPTVDQVRRAFDPSGVMGLVEEVEDFLVLAYAAVSGREVLRGGTPVRDPVPGKLPDDAELVRPPMPPPAEWQRALDLAGRLFGISLGGRALNARNLRQLSEKLEAKRAEAVSVRAQDLASLLLERRRFFEGDPPRLVTARRVGELLTRLDPAEPVSQVEALSSLEPATSPQAMCQHLVAARKTVECLADDLVFHSFEGLVARSEGEARGILDEVRRVLEADQLVEDLASRLRELALRAQRLVSPPVPGGDVIAQGSGRDLEALEADVPRIREALAEAEEGARLAFEWRIIGKRR